MLASQRLASIVSVPFNSAVLQAMKDSKFQLAPQKSKMSQPLLLVKRLASETTSVTVQQSLILAADRTRDLRALPSYQITGDLGWRQALLPRALRALCILQLLSQDLQVKQVRNFLPDPL